MVWAGSPSQRTRYPRPPPLTHRLSPKLSSSRTFKAACWWIPVRFTCVLQRTLFIQDPGAWWTVVTHKAMPWMHSNQRSVPLRDAFVLGYQSGLSGEIAVWTHEAAPSRALPFPPPQRSADWSVYGNCTAYPLSLTTIQSVLLWYAQELGKHADVHGSRGDASLFCLPVQQRRISSIDAVKHELRSHGPLTIRTTARHSGLIAAGAINL